MFKLHPVLEKDSVLIGRLSLCQVRLIRDANYPWVILVPEREGITEIHQLDEQDRALLSEESAFVAFRMQELFGADKMNIAAIGNMVPQLHIHHIARYQTDPAWPAPVWGKLPMKPYGDEELMDRVSQLAVELQLD
jgi:diadenosine tetraphosphate (Ap4A) HIT family hydrolase